MSVEYHWVGSRVKSLFDLWKPLFPLEDNKINGENELRDNLTQRILAFRSLRKFLMSCKKLHNDSILKAIGTLLCSFAGFIINLTQKNSNQFNIEKYSGELMAAKYVTS